MIFFYGSNEVPPSENCRTNENADDPLEESKPVARIESESDASKSDHEDLPNEYQPQYS